MMKFLSRELQTLENSRAADRHEQKKESQREAQNSLSELAGGERTCARWADEEVAVGTGRGPQPG